MDASFTFVFPLLSSQTFTSSGTFVVPAGVNHVYVIGCGGGGGAAGGCFQSSNANACDGVPGGGAALAMHAMSVTPGDSLAVTIGAGGTGGSPAAGSTGYGSSGTAGGDSSFNGVVFYGGCAVYAANQATGYRQYQDGGNGPFGRGGSSSITGASTGGNAAANSGAGGGAGGRGVSGINNGGAGGNGGSGKIVICWATKY